MKIVIAHNRYSSAQPSGENTIVDFEIGALREAGVEVVPFLRSSDEIASLPAHKKAALAASPIHAAGTQRELAALLERERPDLLHLHNPYPLLSPSVVGTAHKHGVKVVQTIHNYRHDCVNGLYFRDGHDCHDCHGKRWNGPGVLHACYRGSRPQSAVMAVALGVHQGTWRGVDRFIALTDAMAAYLRSIGIRDEQIRVKPNGVADPLAGKEAQSGAVPLGSGFLFGARLVPEKGVALLLDAWKRTDLPGQVLRIAGDGPLRSLVERAAAERDDIEYLGQLEPAERDEALAASAAVVVPSIWRDILPTTGIEALAAGRAVVATRMGGAPFIAGADTDAPAGVAVEPAADALARGLEAVAKDPSYAANARHRYETVFAPEVTLRRQIEIYEELIKA
ncbi:MULTISPECIES: glycosyltransferase family 4 protein [Glycomyces]|uniref:Glycosyltransferase family 4 protein n=2 Tax=Glycomyces TaxID=58113 RepID=A0A9X3PMC7_9ACTN|nr:glycosyltransferase family 4 protein [Glycomyces lechevalierae]MDA1387432.1 glycosyltransferase family 4 protein [Glycomyces lechevalierae]MDR7338607.1 glycosyltransferase involved in cell wall biosynthesis [Glycomyces lechevalierae]